MATSTVEKGNGAANKRPQQNVDNRVNWNKIILQQTEWKLAKR